MRKKEENAVTFCAKDWMSAVAHKCHPHSKTIKVVNYYFTTIGYDDINLEYNRSFDGYRNEHFNFQPEDRCKNPWL